MYMHDCNVAKSVKSIELHTCLMVMCPLNAVGFGVLLMENAADVWGFCDWKMQRNR